jgi:P27 family predicted phage terminase small subunit
MRPDRKPPSHLTAPAKRLWRELYEMAEWEAHEVPRITVACEAWERGQQARREIQKHGLTLIGANGNRVLNPAARVERDSKTLFLRALRELGLDALPAGEDATRIPSIAPNAHRLRAS